MKAILLAALMTSLMGSAQADEDSLYREISGKAARGERGAVLKLCTEFMKKYPVSRRAPDIRLFQSDAEPDPQKAAAGYAALVAAHPRHHKSEYAQQRLCEVLFLQSQYRRLAQESGRGLTLFPGGRHRESFLMFKAQSLYHMGMFARAKTACVEIIDRNTDRAALPGMLLFMASVEKKITGYSKDYISGLRDIARGFPAAAETPAAIYMIGEYYEHHRDRDRAFSAYADLAARFPASPEAAMASGKIEELSKTSPRRIEYLPDESTVNSADSIDISHDTPVDEDDADAHFSVSVGPMESLQRVRDMKSLLREFRTISVQTRDGMMLYVGSCPTSDRALSLKIRLAEEFGINGTIVKFSSTASRKFIYGE